MRFEAKYLLQLHEAAICRVQRYVRLASSCESSNTQHLLIVVQLCVGDLLDTQIEVVDLVKVVGFRVRIQHHYLVFKNQHHFV